MRIKRNTDGFTIIELMIATAVLSVILIMATTLMINIGNLYYKGVNQARVQDTSRTILDDVSSHLRLGTQVLSGGTLNRSPWTIEAFCVDNTRYSYVQGMKIGSPMPHAFWRDTLVTPGCAAPADLSRNDPETGPNAGVPGSGEELVGTNSRISYFNLSGTSSPYSVTVGVAYGDNNLLQSNGLGSNIRCLGSTGDQFCSTAQLSTTVDKRSQ